MVLGIAIVLLTPGPTNTLLAAAGLRQGLKRSIVLIGAELAGYLVSISLWGHVLLAAAQRMPGVGSGLRVASGCYIAYLAFKMWRAAADLGQTAQTPVGLRAMFVATLCNPKGLLFASTLIPASAFSNWHDYGVAMTLFAGLLVPIAFAWIGFGAALGRGGMRWLDPVHLQRGASIVLGMFSLSLAWAAFH